jgi:L-histidine N-alpha-methyltransferase
MNVDEDEVAELLLAPHTVLGLSDAGAHASQLCDACFSTHLLGHWVREKRTLGLEQAVHMLTARPAEVFGLADRGRLARRPATSSSSMRRGGRRPLRRVYDQPAGADRLVSNLGIGGDRRRQCRATRSLGPAAPARPSAAPRARWRLSMLRPAPRQRYALIEAPANRAGSDFAAAVAAGLSLARKTLPCRFLYDARGSALFEAICETPEYYLTRAEHEILERRAGAIAARFGAPITLAELGSGSARKTRLLIEAFSRGTCFATCPSTSRAALERRDLVARYPGLEICAIASEYHAGLRLLRAATAGPKLVAWLGSNIGNFERSEAAGFLRRVRGALADEDRLLLGVDLRKPREVLEAAYDDARGVTARFTLNLLVRINRELGGRFSPAAFAHRARWLEDEGRIEIHLVSRERQRVAIAALGLTVAFEKGEAIHVEDSFKYSPAEIDELLKAASLRCEVRWLDAQDRFALVLCAPEEAGS